MADEHHSERSTKLSGLAPAVVVQSREALDQPLSGAGMCPNGLRAPGCTGASGPATDDPRRRNHPRMGEKGREGGGRQRGDRLVSARSTMR